jgi:hypothetical protein
MRDESREAMKVFMASRNRLETKGRVYRFKERRNDESLD